MRSAARFLRSDLGVLLLSSLLIVSLAGLGLVGYLLYETDSRVKQLETDLTGRIGRGDARLEKLQSELTSELASVEAGVDNLEDRVGEVEVLAGRGPEFQDLAELAGATAEALQDIQVAVDGLQNSVQQTRLCFNQALRTSFTSFELGIRAGNLFYTVAQC